MNTSWLLVALALTSTLIVGCSGGSAIASMSPTPDGTSTDTERCANITAFADLQGCDLSGANLTGAFLVGANLSGANLTGANLVGANLKGADLRGADLTGANLSLTDLDGAVMPDGSIHP